MPYLLANNGPDTGRRFELTEAEYIVGRHPDCQIVIDVGAVSRQHAKVMRQGNAYSVEDLHSRNGTFLNNQPVHTREELQEGDQIRVCDVVLTFHEGPLLSPGIQDSSYGAVLVDDHGAPSTIMSKLEVSSSAGGSVRVSASAEAKLQALVEINQSLGKALSLDEVLPQVLNSLFKIYVQADRGFIVLRDDNGRLIPRWTKVRRQKDEDTIRISRTIINRVMDSKEAILSADAASDSRFDMSQSIADFRIRSMMCVPLIDSDAESIGALQIDTVDTGNRYTEEDLELLASIASQASIAINNAQLHEQALKQRAIERELEVANEVQRGFLPSRRPDLEGYQFYDYYRPANHVGGDYYDYMALADGRVAVIVADVVGHGVAAALLMAKLSAESRVALAVHAKPADAITQLNNTLSQTNLDRFVTLVMAVIHPKKNVMTVVNAGHMAPLVRGANGKLSEPGTDVRGLPLGITDGIDYQQETVKLKPGDLVFMYTDGINEYANAEGEQYGIERIRQRMKSTKETPETLGSGIIQDVRDFAGSGNQEDDMCLVSFCRCAV